MVGADHVTPEFDFSLQQRGGGLGRFLVARVQIHAAVGKKLLHLSIVERNRSALLSLSTIGRGVLAGASSMCQKSILSFS